MSGPAKDDRTPNPGSPEAVAEGCKCPVFDNCHGKGYLGRTGLFVFSAGCPVHCPMAPKGERSGTLKPTDRRQFAFLGWCLAWLANFLAWVHLAAGAVVWLGPWVGIPVGVACTIVGGFAGFLIQLAAERA